MVIFLRYLCVDINAEQLNVFFYKINETCFVLLLNVISRALVFLFEVKLSRREVEGFFYLSSRLYISQLTLIAMDTPINARLITIADRRSVVRFVRKPAGGFVRI